MKHVNHYVEYWAGHDGVLLSCNPSYPISHLEMPP
eukprot:CAMPEP_0117649652 /NCGR_PEP_ID=MMETSP0804-20121206/1093_1 /TAXON_ID=1074897 /ORGANISM="Tetraselmis astigmatica, Strain CCMP880" /LENGTH=34 /DNA_ID= /DNA_START= /DNA_END= /DNA_ORIENTATION=